MGNEYYLTTCFNCQTEIMHSMLSFPEASGLNFVGNLGPWKVYYHLPSQHYILVDDNLKFVIATCVPYKDMDSILDLIEEYVRVCDLA